MQDSITISELQSAADSRPAKFTDTSGKLTERLSLAKGQSESFTLALLSGLQNKRPMWQGDNTPGKTYKRRAKNKVARQSRRVNRSR